MTMNAIGGYFGLEQRGVGDFPHEDGILLNTGRNAFEYILRRIGHVSKIYLPYYNCDVVLEPIHKLSIPFSFYHIDENFEIKDKIILGPNEYIVVNNYFGIKDKYIVEQFRIWGEKIIVDNSQAFFAKPISGMKAFYSCRKFVGVADGGIAYGVDDSEAIVFDMDDSSEHNSHLFIRNERGAEAGFLDYQINEYRLCYQAIKRMSSFTSNILENVNYNLIQEKRNENFKLLCKGLNELNILRLPNESDFECPMVYPFFIMDKDLRTKLISNKIFVAKYWSNVKYDKGYEIENNFSTYILPLPIDQRYGTEDMNRIITIIKK